MRLICPNCMSNVTVSDDTAGKEAVCPNCGKSFPTPSRYAAEVVPDPAAPVAGPIEPIRTTPHPEPPTPPAPPGYVPPSRERPVEPSGFLSPSAPASAEAPTPTGYTRSIGFTISPTVIAWLPAVLLTALFVFTFFPWVGSYAGDVAVYSQRPWGAMFGASPNPNYALIDAGVTPGGWLDQMRSDWKLLVPFFLALIVGLIFAWADRGLSYIDPRRLPPLVRFWPWRNTVVAACVAVALAMLILQALNGFGMERAIRHQISERFAEKRVQAANSPAAMAKVEYEQDQEFAKYNVQYTTWFYLALLCNLLALAAVLTHIRLERRGNKPPPKLLLHY